jgi:hypothetical protein
VTPVEGDALRDHQWLPERATAMSVPRLRVIVRDAFVWDNRAIDGLDYS